MHTHNNKHTRMHARIRTCTPNASTHACNCACMHVHACMYVAATVAAAAVGGGGGGVRVHARVRVHLRVRAFISGMLTLECQNMSQTSCMFRLCDILSY